METTSKRALNFCNFALLYASMLCLSIFVISFSTEYYTKLTKGNQVINICDLQLYNLDKKPSNERRLVFSPNIDLSGRFNWNVKQIFLYLTVKYQTVKSNGEKEEREDMLWWSIVENKRKSKRMFSRVVSKLPFGELPNKVKLELRGCRQPWVGKIGNEIYFKKTFNL
ncbi:putative signal peptidase complex subunit 3 [Cucumispora dikerogammari]|nr:putative signal peptidase complex subunit 3 [Cucumispora dikerogammari]